MARRDTIIASRTGTEFKGQISGMYLTGASRTAIFRKGNPGGKGGREFHIIAAQTEGGLLGYDLARAALRRSVNLNERLGALGNVEWKEPASKIIGTISGAVLQTVASQIETPELLLNSNFYTASSEISVKEFEREKSSCFYGRRDAYWALMNALANAREFVYIEGPAFSQTGYLPNPPDDNSFDVGTNLLYILKQRMLTQKGLKIVAALSKKLDYGPGYEIFAAREYVKREIAVSCFDGKELTKNGMNKRIIAFHPIGFPGRPLELMTNIVIVDDVFAMLGTSTIRRRGMTFDGGLDLVFTDTTIQDGKPKEIREFRRKLMATHINAIPPKENEMPDPDWVRLYDGNQAFEVFRELLEGGGAGLIESVWDGSTPGQQNVSFDGLSDDAADPDGANISPVQSFFSALAESPPK
jgi:hypothetical protein